MSMFGAVDLSTLASRQDAPTTGGPASPGASANRAAGPAGAAAGSAGPAGSTVAAPLVVDVDAASLRGVAELSMQVPVVIILHTARSQASAELAGQLEALAQEHGGRFQLARVDIDAAPEVAQALQATSVPTVVALIGGQPVPMLQGAIPVDQLRGLLDQLLELAARNGVTGRLAPPDANTEPVEPEETEVERQAREAMERGDYAAAEKVYDHAIAQSPGDAELKAARDQIRLLKRMDGKDPHALLAAADAPGASVEDQLAGADAAVALGDISVALGRGLEAGRSHTGQEREDARLRLLELFDVIGSSSPEVARARRQLAALLF